MPFDVGVGDAGVAHRDLEIPAFEVLGARGADLLVRHRGAVFREDLGLARPVVEEGGVEIKDDDAATTSLLRSLDHRVEDAPLIGALGAAGGLHFSPKR